MTLRPPSSNGGKSSDYLPPPETRQGARRAGDGAPGMSTETRELHRIIRAGVLDYPPDRILRARWAES
jgi:hypothetical protein